MSQLSKLLLVALLLAPVISQENQTYLYLDFYLTDASLVLVHGETNLNTSFPDIDILNGFVIGRANWVEVDGTNREFSFSENITNDTVLNIYLPENSTITYLDTNLRTWFSTKDSRVSFSGEDIAPQISLQYRLGNEANSSIWWLFLPIAATGLVFTKFFRKKEEDKLKPIMSTLNDREKLIINTVKEHGGELKQRILEKEYQLPKASLSRTLFHMEKKGLIERQKMGRTKQIRLGNEYR